MSTQAVARSSPSIYEAFRETGAYARNLSRSAFSKSATAGENLLLAAREVARVAKEVFLVSGRIICDGLACYNFLVTSVCTITLAAYALDLFNTASIITRVAFLLCSFSTAVTALIHFAILATPIESRTSHELFYTFYFPVAIALSCL